MGLRITGDVTVENNLSKARQEAANSLEKLSSGIRFTRAEPLPAERAISDSMGAKLREYTSYKRNANDAVSLVQMGDSALNEMSNITIRMKELATQASSPALSDKERQFLFVEYQGLYDEVHRIAKTTTYNGIPLLDGESTASAAKNLAFRIGPAMVGEDGDINVVRLNSLNDIAATPENLGLKSAEQLLGNDEGVSLDDVADFFESSLDSVSDTFGKAFETISSYRAGFGAVSSRLNRVIGVIDVAHENISSANSRIRDVDYATEVTNLTKAKILMQAGSALLSQTSLPGQAALTLLNMLSRT